MATPPPSAPPFVPAGRLPWRIGADLWRWTLADPGGWPMPSELPEDVFARLPQDPATAHPWLYPSPDAALRGLAVAVAAAAIPDPEVAS